LKEKIESYTRQAKKGRKSSNLVIRFGYNQGKMVISKC